MLYSIYIKSLTAIFEMYNSKISILAILLILVSTSSFSKDSDTLDYFQLILAGLEKPPPPPPPPPPPEGVSILPTWTTYVDSIDYLHIVGEVLNNTDKHIRYVKIIANIYDKDNNLLDTDFTYTRLDNVPAGEKTCFDLALPDPIGRDNILFEPVQYFDDGEPPIDLTLSNVSSSIHPTFGWYEIIGEVTNQESTRIEYVQPIGTLYSYNEKVVDCDFTFVNVTHLEQGQTSAFEMTFSGKDSYTNVTSFRLQVDGSLP